MTGEVLRKARRKDKAWFPLLESPFPIPIQTLTRKESSNERWYYYFGFLQADHVAIYRLGDLTFLFRLVKF